MEMQKVKIPAAPNAHTQDLHAVTKPKPRRHEEDSVPGVPCPLRHCKPSGSEH